MTKFPNAWQIRVIPLQAYLQIVRAEKAKHCRMNPTNHHTCTRSDTTKSYTCHVQAYIMVDQYSGERTHQLLVCLNKKVKEKPSN